MHTICRSQRNDNIPESRIGLNETDERNKYMKSCQLVLVEYVRSDMFPSIECMRNREVNSESRAPQRYDIANTKEYHGNAIRPF